jgi:hypothetical protein
MQKEYIMSMNDEWQRVMANPDNIIVSDSIRDLLDPAQTEDVIEQSKAIIFTCVISAENTTISGRLTGYAATCKDYKFYLELPIGDVHTLLGITRIDTVSVSNSANLVTLEIQLNEDDPDPEISFDLGSSTVPLSSAFVSIVISK